VPSRVLTKQFKDTQVRTRRAILVATCLILSIGTVSAWQMLRLSEDAASIVQSYEAMRTIRRLKEALLSAETGKRGFLLTDDPAYLEDYAAGVQAIPHHVAELRQRLTPYVGPRRQAALEAAVDVKVREMDEVLDLYQRGQRTLAVELVGTNAGKVVMDELRGILELVRREEEGRLAVHRADFRRTRNLGLLTVTAVGVFAILLTFFLLRGQRAVSERLLAAVNIIQGQKGYLEAMLSSVHAPLILLDREGNIRFVNAASELLLNDTTERLVGRPLSDYVQFRGTSEAAGDGTIFERALREKRVLRERRIGIQTPSGPQVIGLTVRPVEVEGGMPIGCMITLRDIDQEEATVEELHQQDRVRDLEAKLGRLVAETASARSLLEHCGAAIRQTTEAESVYVWLGDAADPNGALMLLRPAADLPDADRKPSALVIEAWRRGEPREDLVTEPQRFAFPLSSGPAALGVIEIRARTHLHPRLAAELPRLSSETALGYDRRRNAEKIARMAQEKDRFIATLSHELRGPLVPLKYAVGEMAAGGSTTTNPKLLGLLTRQVTQLERLVDDLLDVQRLQRGTLSLRLAPLDMRAAIEQSVEAALPLFEAKEQKLEVEVEKVSLPLVGDQARLVQVLFNLLNNASRYSAARTSIVLSASRWGKQVEVRVSDHGMGIAKENLERVFDMFEQGSTGGNADGLGIGLALVRQLVVLHGGRVLVSSPGVGAGAMFGISLPMAHAADVPVPERTTPAHRASARGSAAFELEAIDEKPAPADLPAGAFERCVIVDDDVDAAETLALMLERWGFAAQVAHDTVGGLETIERVAPELVLLDLTLPGVDRYFLVEQLRNKPGPRIRIVAVTGHADDAVRSEALEHGFDDLLVKPISAEQLALAVSRSGSGSA